jgi:uncharacterized small protein (DUF1192 family)
VVTKYADRTSYRGDAGWGVLAGAGAARRLTRDDPQRAERVQTDVRPRSYHLPAANDESLDRVDDLLDGRLAALRSEAERLRAALLRGESPESLGLTEDGLARVLEERGIA